MERNNLKKYLKILLKLTISGGALVFVFHKVNIDQVIRLYSSSHVLLLGGGLILFIISKLISAIRLNSLFRNISIYISNVRNFQLYILGMFYNIFLPGSIGGDGYKMIFLKKRYTIKTKILAGSILVDRTSGIVALTTLALIFLLGISEVHQFLVFIIIAIPVIIGIYFLGIHLLFPHFKKIFFRIIGYSFGVQGAQVLCALLILFALGIHEHMYDYLFLFLVSSLVSIIPFTIGGAGARELTFLYGAKFLGIHIDTAIALSLMFYIITVLVSLCGSYYLLHPIQVKEQPESSLQDFSGQADIT